QQAGPGAVTPELMTKYLPSSAASAVAAQTGARGPSNTIVAACASGTLAIGQAYRVLQRGQAQVMIAGGAEAPLFPSFFAGTCALKAMSLRNEEPTKASRPFERDRDGFVMGEGAGIVILETLSHANFRRAKIYGEIIGYGATADAYHITAPEPAGEGIARAMELALREGKIRPDQVDYLNAHGTSTLLNDRCETSAIKKVFGSHAVGKASGGRGLAVSSTKSMTGHLLGAAGAIEFIVCLLAMQESIIPPTINYEHPEPGYDLDYVPNVARPGQVGLAMTNSLGFGGHNASLLVRKFECPAG
nr:beta-ketoacyl-ACP synthase II [Clostridia bacterium]